MTNIGTERVSDALRERAHHYERLGYSILRNPDRSKLPAFLRNYRVDLLARGKTTNVVVEVKTGTELSDKQLTRLAHVLDARPNWRLELVVLEEEQPAVPDTREVRDASKKAKLSPMSLRKRRTIARDLARSRHSPEAVLLLWTVIEGALRLLAHRSDVEFERETPKAIAKQMTMLGYIRQPDYRILEKAADIRNAVVHGRTPTSIDSDLVRGMSDLSRRLLDSLAETRKPKRKRQR